MLSKIRYFFTFLWFILSSFPVCIFYFFRPFHPNNASIGGKIVSLLAKPIMNYKVHKINFDRFDNMKGKIVVSNHQSNLDVLVMGQFIPKRTVGIGKKQILYIPLFGQAFYLSGNILIDRTNKKKAFESLDRARDKMLKDDMNIWIMPEGTRSQGKGLLPFKKGPFHRAIHANADIIPVVISEYHKTLDLNKINSGNIVVKVLETYKVEGKSKEDIPDMMIELHNIMKAELDKVNELALNKG